MVADTFRPITRCPFVSTDWTTNARSPKFRVDSQLSAFVSNALATKPFALPARCAWCLHRAQSSKTDAKERQPAKWFHGLRKCTDRPSDSFTHVAGDRQARRGE